MYSDGLQQADDNNNTFKIVMEEIFKLLSKSKEL